jgi:hypothetical protein
MFFLVLLMLAIAEVPHPCTFLPLSEIVLLRRQPLYLQLSIIIEGITCQRRQSISVKEAPPSPTKTSFLHSKSLYRTRTGQNIPENRKNTFLRFPKAFSITPGTYV